jgi:hypothetical protein
MSIEYVLWGVPPGKKDEDLLIGTQGGKPITSKSQADKLKVWLETEKKCKKVRIQTLDLSTPPDFMGTIRTTKAKKVVRKIAEAKGKRSKRGDPR